jgi:hypothetical protein
MPVIIRPRVPGILCKMFSRAFDKMVESNESSQYAIVRVAESLILGFRLLRRVAISGS